MSFPRPIIYCAFSNDADYTLRLSKEEDVISNVLTELDRQSKIEYKHKDKASLDDVYNFFNNYHNRIFIFHYGGHSDSESLHLQDHIAISKELAIIIGQQKHLKLVFLNGCANQAQVSALLAKGVPAVIATQESINDSQAIVLAEQFYKALASGKTIRESFDAAASYLKQKYTDRELFRERGLRLREESPENSFPWGLYYENEAVLDWHISQVSLPQELVQNLLTQETPWTEFLREEFRTVLNISVRRKSTQIISEYGWLIAEILRKLLTTQSDDSQPLRAFSYMTEAWQSTLRYLCYIQIGQWLRAPEAKQNAALIEFLTPQKNESPSPEREAHFDYLSLLLDLVNYGNEPNLFMPELPIFVRELADTNSDLYQVATFLDQHRRRLLVEQIPVEELPKLMDEYLTALIHWLRKIAFLALYRLVSIKEIYLNYRIGGIQSFVHIYGELHSFYNEAASDEEYSEKSIQEKFTYNQSVLLFKGRNMEECLDNIGDPNTFISLSPMLIDQSVFSGKPTQTPEIYYFTGSTSNWGQVCYAHFKNELPLNQGILPSNKFLTLGYQNPEHPKLNNLHKYLKEVFEPLTRVRP